MSIVSFMMSGLATSMRYNSVNSANSALDTKRSMANSTDTASQKPLFNYDKDLDSQLVQGSLQCKAADAMEDSSKKLRDDWAKSFRVFA